MSESETDRKLKVFYEQASKLRKSSRESRSMKIVEEDSHRRLFSMLKQIEFNNKFIADIGGADGAFLFTLADKKMIDKTTSATLIDISSEYIARGKKIYKKTYNNKFKFRAICSNVNNLKAKQVYDIIFFREIFEHLYFPDETLRVLSRLLKKDGLLVITTPNSRRLSELAKKILSDSSKEQLKASLGTDVPEIAKLEKKLGVKEHFHEYTKKELFTILKKNGFSIVRYDVSRIPFIAQSLCDRSKFVFFLQKSFIFLLTLLGLKKPLGFEHLIVAKVG